VEKRKDNVFHLVMDGIDQLLSGNNLLPEQYLTVANSWLNLVCRFKVLFQRNGSGSQEDISQGVPPLIGIRKRNLPFFKIDLFLGVELLEAENSCFLADAD